MAGSPREGEIAAEQAVLSRLYQRLDELRAQTRARLAEVRRRGATGTPQARSERDSFAAMYEDRLAALDAAESGLCFGRLDLTDGQRFHVGRIGLSDEGHEALLVDWRAPAAAAFYRATPAEPLGVTRRRHLRTRGRRVLDIEDDVLDVARVSDRRTLTGAGALLAALEAGRTGRMRDIVATIQAEQDRIIRDDVEGMLVVQGGPGTGKTAVALHRAAYLLYTERERLSRSGVLIVGPGTAFLRYIEQVLPGLGETAVVTATLAGLLPAALGVPDDGLARDRPATARCKADPRMAVLIQRAVDDLQQVPEAPVSLAFDELDLVLTPADIRRARGRARRSRHPHNRARYAFAKHLLRLLVGRLTDIDPDLARQRWVARQLAAQEEFRDLVDRCWPRRSASELVRQLLSDPDRLARLAEGVFDTAEQRLLLRPPSAPWTDADVPLLDEAWARLGDPEEMLRRAAARRRQAADREFARQVIADTGVAGLVSPDTLAARFAGSDGGALAERAAADPGWRYGHVVVDEAQELSPMAWRMIVRRCPERSMTVVGDLGQAAAPWAPARWAEVLDTVAPARWRLRELTVSYRTPAEVMALAGAVLARVDPHLPLPEPVRRGGRLPLDVPVASWAEALQWLAGRDDGPFAGGGAGRAAVIVPDELAALLVGEIVAALNGRAAAGADGLDAAVAVLTPEQAKGLEFDEVVVVEPAAWWRAGASGRRGLYVALTRTTAGLTLLHREPLPEVLAEGLRRLTASVIPPPQRDPATAPLPATGTAP